MRVPDPRIATPLWHRPWVSAAITIAVTFAIATIVDRLLRGRFLRAAVRRTGISREADTRLRFVRRLIYAAILIVGITVALSYFGSISRLAASLLASGVIAAAVVGFAARQVLANVVAGMMLAVTQPLRVGDWVTVEGNYGVVEDVRLNYTILRTLSNARVVVPNERLAGGILRNDTLVVDVVAPDVSIWLAPGADVERALAALAGYEASVAEVTVEGVRLAVSADPVPPPEKAAREAQLRRECLRALREEPRTGSRIDDPAL